MQDNYNEQLRDSTEKSIKENQICGNEVEAKLPFFAEESPDPKMNFSTLHSENLETTNDELLNSSDKPLNTTRRYNKPILGSNFGKPTKIVNSKTRKRVIDPAISYIKSLIKIYPKMEKLEYDNNVICNGRTFPQYNYVYGEINYDGIERLYKVLMSMFFDEYVFIDLGSGNGKFPLYLASKQQIVRSFGVELVKERYDFSLVLLNKLKKRIFQQFIHKIHFHNEDIFNIDFSKMVSIRNEPTLKSIIWISNLCFKEEHTKGILEKLSQEVEEGSLVCFSRIFNNIITKPLKNTIIQHNTRIKNTDFLFVRTINIGMSWNTEHLVHIFIKSVDDFEDDDDSDEEESDEEELYKPNKGDV